jgi:hypothetical protein
MSRLALSQRAARFLAATPENGLWPGFAVLPGQRTPGWQGGRKKAFSPPRFGPAGIKDDPREIEDGNQ